MQPKEDLFICYFTDAASFPGQTLCWAGFLTRFYSRFLFQVALRLYRGFIQITHITLHKAHLPQEQTTLILGQNNVQLLSCSTENPNATKSRAFSTGRKSHCNSYLCFCETLILTHQTFCIPQQWKPIVWLSKLITPSWNRDDTSFNPRQKSFAWPALTALSDGSPGL